MKNRTLIGIVCILLAMAFSFLVLPGIVDRVRTRPAIGAGMALRNVPQTERSGF